MNGGKKCGVAGMVAGITILYQDLPFIVFSYKVRINVVK